MSGSKIEFPFMITYIMSRAKTIFAYWFLFANFLEASLGTQALHNVCVVAHSRKSRSTKGIMFMSCASQSVEFYIQDLLYLCGPFSLQLAAFQCGV